MMNMKALDKAKSLLPSYTRSYEEPMTKTEMRSMIGKVLIKFQRIGGKSIDDMSEWLNVNNLGNYQNNRWVRAMIDTLFSRKSGTWLPINQNLSVDQLTDKSMTF